MPSYLFPASLPEATSDLVTTMRLIFPAEIAFHGQDLWDEEGITAYWIKDDDGTSIGLVVTKRKKEEFDGFPTEWTRWVLVLGVVPARQGSRHGTEALNHVIGLAEAEGDAKVLAGMRTDNRLSIHLFNKKMGFRYQGILPGYYRDPPGDAAIYILPLPRK